MSENRKDQCSSGRGFTFRAWEEMILARNPTWAFHWTAFWTRNWKASTSKAAEAALESRKFLLASRSRARSGSRRRRRRSRWLSPVAPVHQRTCHHLPAVPCPVPPRSSTRHGASSWSVPWRRAQEGMGAGSHVALESERERSRYATHAQDSHRQLFWMMLCCEIRQVSSSGRRHPSLDARSLPRLVGRNQTEAGQKVHREI